MSTPTPASTRPMAHAACAEMALPVTRTSRGVLPSARRFQRKAYGLLLLALLAGACSEDKTRTSELRSDAAAPAAETSAETPSAAAPDDSGTPPRGSTRYRVAAETAYFFDVPAQGKPSGNYLLRGDVVYGEEERNGFVKTRFVKPNGATVVGWLKAPELSRLAGSVAPRTAPPRPAAAPAASAEDTYSYEEPQERPAAATTEAATAVVKVPRSYFYNSPDLSQPRKAHCVQGDKVRLGESRGEAVYVTFTNWEKVTTTGWMRKDALRYSR